MKRIILGLLLGGMSFLLQAEDARAFSEPRNKHQAEIITDQASCLAQDTVTFPGPSIAVFAQKTAPANVIAIGQDEDKRGVDITITVTSLPGTAIYYNWVRKETDDVPYKIGSYIPKGMECRPLISGWVSCYWVYYNCEQAPPETVYRMLRPEMTRVWLDPDINTRNWLRWSGTPSGDPLRFVFPDDWGLGAWTPEGVKKRSYPGSGNEWWTFLYGDPLYVSIPTTSMLKFYRPNPSGYSIEQVLGLWGAFSSFPGESTFAEKGNIDQCLIDSAHVLVEGGNPEYTNRRGCVVRTLGAIPDQARILWIDFNNIPLDLPGKWHIGMTANQYPALYAKGTRTESNLRDKIDEYSPKLRIGPSPEYTPNGYDISSNSFVSYIVISTPCYSADPKSCVN